jgi:hypothetical protein
MNSTNIISTSKDVSIGWEYSTIILGVLFFTSEVMPFLKKTKGNGLAETLVCLLRGSSCMAEKIADTIEQQQKPKEVV